MRYPEVVLPKSEAINETSPEVEALAEKSKHWIWDVDPVRVLPEAGISVASVFYGTELADPEAIYQNAVRIMRAAGYEGDVPRQGETTGFPVLRQIPEGLSDAEYRLSENLVAREIIGQALAAQGLVPGQVDMLLAATSIPIHPDFADDWAAAAGLPKSVHIEPYCMACNSSGRALADVLSGEYDADLARRVPGFDDGVPAIIVLFALDDAHRLSHRGSDPLTPQFFSTGAAAVVLKYHPSGENSLRIIAHHSEAIEFGTQYLKVLKTYGDWPEAVQRRLHTARYLKPTTDGKSVDMQARAGLAFIKGGETVLKSAVAKYEAAGHTLSEIKRVIVHHPSRPVFDELKSRMLTHGFVDEQINWVINEGNVPVCTIPIALGRQLYDLEVGDQVMFLSFGAGGEYTCFVAEVGGTLA